MTESLSQSIAEINTERRYWFIRTDSGKHFDTFLENDFVGIGWNGINEDDIRNRTIEEVKAKIARLQGYDANSKASRMKITSVYNKIKKFDEIKKNDIIVVPSEHSAQLAFGTIMDDGIYFDAASINECNYKKRRRVSWIRSERISQLDPIFYKIVPSRHAISEIRGYDRFIDNLTNSLYRKNGFTHFVLEVTRQGDINFDALLSTMNGIDKLYREINAYFELNEPDGGMAIKLNVQSRGRIELKNAGIGIILVGMVLASCNNPRAAVPQLDINGKNIPEFMGLHQNTVDTIDNGMAGLDIEINRINNNPH